jgi:hypothetical protein
MQGRKGMKAKKGKKEAMLGGREEGKKEERKEFDRRILTAGVAFGGLEDRQAGRKERKEGTEGRNGRKEDKERKEGEGRKAEEGRNVKEGRKKAERDSEEGRTEYK